MAFFSLNLSTKTIFWTVSCRSKQLAKFWMVFVVKTVSLAIYLTVYLLYFRIDIQMMEAESLDSVFLDLESEAVLRSKVTELKCRLEQRPGSSSTTSSTSEGSLRTRAVRLLSSLSDEVSHRMKFTLTSPTSRPSLSISCTALLFISSWSNLFSSIISFTFPFKTCSSSCKQTKKVAIEEHISSVTNDCRCQLRESPWNCQLKILQYRCRLGFNLLRPTDVVTLRYLFSASNCVTTLDWFCKSGTDSSGPGTWMTRAFY